MFATIQSQLILAAITYPQRPKMLGTTDLDAICAGIARTLISTQHTRTLSFSSLLLSSTIREQLGQPIIPAHLQLLLRAG